MIDNRLPGKNSGDRQGMDGGKCVVRIAQSISLVTTNQNQGPAGGSSTVSAVEQHCHSSQER